MGLRKIKSTITQAHRETHFKVGDRVRFEENHRGGLCGLGTYCRAVNGHSALHIVMPDVPNDASVNPEGVQGGLLFFDHELTRGSPAKVADPPKSGRLMV